MSELSLLFTIPCANTLGEDIQWNARDQSFWWTDIHGARLYRYQLDGGQLRHWDLPERLGCFAFAQRDERLLAGFASGLAWFDPDTGVQEWLAKPESHLPGNRANDGRCDRQGRFWMGTLVEQDQGQVASLYCLDQQLQLTSHLQGLRISNALCWSSDGCRMYHADSPSHSIQVYDFDPLSGRPGNPRLFAATEPGIEPDGACVDAQGCVWNAHWGGGRVVRYTPDGRECLRLDLPVSQPTCVAFGGEQLNLLAVTSARVGLSDVQLAAQPQAGHVFIFQTPFRGLPESRFGG